MKIWFYFGGINNININNRPTDNIICKFYLIITQFTSTSQLQGNEIQSNDLLLLCYFIKDLKNQNVVFLYENTIVWNYLV